jgi:hypothetical protein
LRLPHTLQVLRGILIPLRETERDAYCTAGGACYGSEGCHILVHNTGGYPSIEINACVDEGNADPVTIFPQERGQRSPDLKIPAHAIRAGAMKPIVGLLWMTWLNSRWVDGCRNGLGFQPGQIDSEANHTSISQRHSGAARKYPLITVGCRRACGVRAPHCRQ